MPAAKDATEERNSSYTEGCPDGEKKLSAEQQEFKEKLDERKNETAAERKRRKSLDKLGQEVRPPDQPSFPLRRSPRPRRRLMQCPACCCRPRAQ